MGILSWHKQKSRERTAAAIDVPLEERAIVCWQWSYRQLEVCWVPKRQLLLSIGVVLPRYRTICITCVAVANFLLQSQLAGVRFLSVTRWQHAVSSGAALRSSPCFFGAGNENTGLCRWDELVLRSNQETKEDSLQVAESCRGSAPIASSRLYSGKVAAFHPCLYTNLPEKHDCRMIQLVILRRLIF